MLVILLVLAIRTEGTLRSQEWYLECQLKVKSGGMTRNQLMALELQVGRVSMAGVMHLDQLTGLESKLDNVPWSPITRTLR